MKSKAPTEIAFGPDGLIGGLDDALAHARGKLTLKTGRAATAGTGDEAEGNPRGARRSESQPGFVCVAAQRAAYDCVEMGAWRPQTVWRAALRFLEIAKRAPEALIPR